MSSSSSGARTRTRISGAFYTLVPIRPRRRGERRSLRTLPGASLRPPLAFNPDTPRPLSTPTDAYELHPDIALYGTTLSVDAREFAQFFDIERSNVFLPRLVALFDVSGDGHMSLYEFVVCLAQFSVNKKQSEHVYFAWRLFDTDDSGAMTKDEFVEALSGAFILITLVPIRPRWRCELHSLRTFSPGVRLSPPTPLSLSRRDLDAVQIRF